mgnify:CR=1 FL=1
MKASAFSFARDDFAHGLNIQLVLVAPGILFEENQILRRQIRDAHTTRFEIPQARTKIIERFATHPGEHIEDEIFDEPDRAFLHRKVLRFEFPRPAFAPAAAMKLPVAAVIPRGASAGECHEPQGIVLRLNKGEELFAEGESAEYFYKIMSGTVRTYKLLSDGRRQIDAFHLKNDIFGIEALLLLLLAESDGPTEVHHSGA